MKVATRGMSSYTLGELVGRRTVAAGDKAWGSAMLGISKASTCGLDCVAACSAVPKAAARGAVPRSCRLQRHQQQQRGWS